QRITRCVDLVKDEPRVKAAQPERRVRADQVHLVAPIGERLPQLRGDDAAAAHGRVADDADIHARPWGFGPWSPLSASSTNNVSSTIGSLTMKPSANATPESAPNCASRLSISCWKRGDVRRV